MKEIVTFTLSKEPRRPRNKDMETGDFCENCLHFTEHNKRVFLSDGICTVVINKPRPVRKKMPGCKYYTKRKEDLNVTDINIR